jgi:hypothetical protein
MTLQIPIRKEETQTELFFPMQLKQMTDKETKEYHLKRLHELILKSLEKNPRVELEDPNEEQRQKMLAIWTREETY